ncbi:MAG: caspase family protein, partial [Candidatus Rokuibacteriota bacterium]
MKAFRLVSLLALTAVLNAGCRYAAIAVATGVIGAVILADQFLVVDCALPETPGAARQAIKTSAHDCKSRGGQFVEAAQATQQTALGVWLPIAEQGDRAAQSHVGEIYEKGLGVAPNHAAAAQWYRRAAVAGDARGAVNLAQLY